MRLGYKLTCDRHSTVEGPWGRSPGLPGDSSTRPPARVTPGIVHGGGIRGPRGAGQLPAGTSYNRSPTTPARSVGRREVAGRRRSGTGDILDELGIGRARRLRSVGTRRHRDRMIGKLMSLVNAARRGASQAYAPVRISRFGQRHKVIDVHGESNRPTLRALRVIVA